MNAEAEVLEAAILQAAREVAACYEYGDMEPNVRAVHEGRLDHITAVRLALDAVRAGVELPRALENQTAWLIEMVEPEVNKPPTPRWWHPEHGWMWDANKALRFCREQDALDYIRHGKGSGGLMLPGKPKHHEFVTAAAWEAIRKVSAA